MKIRGKEIGFLRTPMTVAELADIAPDGDFNKLMALFSEDKYQVDENGEVIQDFDLKEYKQMIEALAKIICTLQKAYELNKAYYDRNYEPQFLTVEEILYLPTEEFAELGKYAMAHLNDGTETTIEAEPVKKKEETMNQE